MLIRLWFICMLLVFLSSCQRSAETAPFESYWQVQPDRIWIGPEYWANRLQDWHIREGRLECTNGALPNRTLHLLTHYLTDRPGSLNLQVDIMLTEAVNTSADKVYCGFLICAGNGEMDYRKSAIIHRTYGKHGGIIASFNGNGDLILLNNQTADTIARAECPVARSSFDLQGINLSLQLIPKGKEYQLVFTAGKSENLTELNRLVSVLPESLITGGNLALVSSGGRFSFNHWKIRGSKVKYNGSRLFGPVMGTLYTLSDHVLKLTAQLPPLSEADEPEVELQLLDIQTGNWKTAATRQMQKPGYLASFRISSWKSGMNHDYRIVYHLLNEKAVRTPFYYYGTIFKDPLDKDEFVAAVFTGNSNSHGSIGNGAYNFENVWFPHQEITYHVAKHHPDLLIYTGDNVYEARPTPPDYSSFQNNQLDYLYKWYMFLWAHGELTRNIPAITIPDDHDVYHGNIWGAGGAKAPESPPGGQYPDYYKGFERHWQQDQGGYKLSPGLVNMIQRTQTAHLPDPFDPEPVKQGIGVYFCNLNYGRISWAVLEDRKFKSAPGKIHPEYRIVNGFSQLKEINGSLLDSPEATLLGERQLDFIRAWASDWKDVDMKVTVSQTIFANLSTYPDTFLTDAQTPRLQPLPRGVIPGDYTKAKDMDSNGWPQTGRNKALREFRKGFALMVGGDQHLGSVIHHGIENWEDAGYSFCVPSIANLWPRRWFPPSPGENHIEGMPPYTGRYLDGFGNRMTVMAVSNPYQSGKEPSLLHDRAPGYGIIRLNRNTQLITLECWPRYSDPESFNAEQYPGWPVKLEMKDNYAREPVAWLPPMQITGLQQPPVVQVVNEITGEIIYTLRIKGDSFQPWVFEEGSYSVNVGEPGTRRMQSLSGLEPAGREMPGIIKVTFD